MSSSSFLPASIGYIGALSMVIGFSYYVLREFELSWRTIEPLGYLGILALLSTPFSSFVEHLSTNVLRLTSFLGLLALPIMIILTLILHVKKGDNFFLAGAFICLVTALLSYVYDNMLNSKIISFYAVLNTWGAIQFITAQIFKNTNIWMENAMEISALMSFLFMGFGLFRYIGTTQNSDLTPGFSLELTPQVNQQELDMIKRINSYVTILGLLAYLLIGTARTLINNGAADLLLIISVVGLYYLIETNAGIAFIEIPLSLGTATYIFSKLFMNLCTRDRFPLFLILVGAALYAMSIYFQMRSAKIKTT